MEQNGTWYISSSICVIFDFFHQCFIVSCLTFRSLIHFEFIFVCGVRKCSSFILLQVVDQFSQHHLLKRLSLIHCIFLPPLLKIRCPQVCGFISGLSILFHWSIFLSLCQYHTVLMTVALTQQSHCWAYTPRKPELKETHVPQCSSQHCL